MALKWALAWTLLWPTFAPAQAQTTLSLVAPDGRIGCIQGMTGIGRPPAWENVAEREAPGGWALAETAGDATDLRFPICILPGGILRDLEATLRLKIVSGTQQAGGLVVRAQDATNYYVIRASAIDKTVKLYRVQKGRRAQVASKEAPVKSGEWHTLAVKLVNDKFDVSFDGAELFSVTDRSLPQPGAIGVWSQADSVTHFGAITLKDPSPR